MAGVVLARAVIAKVLCYEIKNEKDVGKTNKSNKKKRKKKDKKEVPKKKQKKRKVMESTE